MHCLREGPAELYAPEDAAKEGEHMELVKLTERIWYYPYEDERDRPVLGYIRGDRMSLAVDAGHSAAHVDDFYAALEKEGLPLPSLTAITHWHWDHTFGMHKAKGLTVAGAATNAHLRGIIGEMGSEGDRLKDFFTALDLSVCREYEGDAPMIVRTADLEFKGSMIVDLGSIHVCLRETVSPHTDDAVLVWIPEEKCLFVGDATSGVFPDWTFKPEPMEELIREIARLDCRYVLHGHVPVMSGKEMTAHLEEELAERKAELAAEAALAEAGEDAP